eukprot:14968441-Alexandrium_andersonii.AAC.1
MPIASRECRSRTSPSRPAATWSASGGRREGQAEQAWLEGLRRRQRDAARQGRRRPGGAAAAA